MSSIERTPVPGHSYPNAADLDGRGGDLQLPPTPALDEESPFGSMMSLFDEAAKRLGVEQDEYQILRKPDREITYSVPVKLDNGRYVVFDSYRVQHLSLIHI